jgi:hypothetical protein
MFLAFNVLFVTDVINRATSHMFTEPVNLKLIPQSVLNTVTSSTYAVT